MPASTGHIAAIPQHAENVVQAIAPVARPSRLRRRHLAWLVSLLLFVFLPSGLSGYYLYFIAADQYSSVTAFTLRTEEPPNPLAALETLGQVPTAQSADSDILYDFIHSQQMVAGIDDRLDLNSLYSRPPRDPVFAYTPDQPIEELTEYWSRMVHVDYDRSAGLIRVEAFAFTAEDAQEIARAIVAESDALVDRLSHIAQADTTRFAQDTLHQSEQRLKELRLQLTKLRSTQQIINPSLDLEIRMGVVTALQQQLAEVLVQQDMLRQTTRDGDPRLDRFARQIDALKARISQERSEFSDLGEDGGFVDLVGQFESLQVDLEFAQQAYVAAATGLDTAMAEARKRSRYLATHVSPTLAQSPLFPRRALILSLITGACVMVWLMAVLIFYAIRDRS